MADPTPIVAIYIRPDEIEYLENLHSGNEYDSEILEEILRRIHAGQGIKKTK